MVLNFKPRYKSELKEITDFIALDSLAVPKNSLKIFLSN